MMLVLGCDTTDSNDEGIGGVDLDALFGAPTPAEVESVRAEWASRDVSPVDVQVLATDTLEAFGVSQRVQVVSHEVAGITHIGAIVVPIADPAASLPVVVYNHFGDEGVNLEETLAVISFGFSGINTDFIFVVPSFRDETLTADGMTYRSDGPASPWNFDVDDSIALLNVALELVPQADASRIGTIGVSRGGAVSLIMAARDPRIDFVVNYFGPTNFLLDSSREETESALQGDQRDLPGLSYLNSNWLLPYRDGEKTLEEVRLEYIRRSPVFFSESLPAVQVHHGTLDDIVPVEHAQSLEEVFMRDGKPETEYDVYLYPGAGHDLIEMPESFARAAAFFNDRLGR